MTSPRRLTGALVAFLLIPMPQAEGEGAQPPEVRSLEADQLLLRQVVSEARITTDRSKPGPTLWLQDAGLAVGRRMAGWMERVLPKFARRAAPFFEPVLLVLLALLAALLLVFLVRLAFEHRRRALPAPRRPGAATDRAAPPPGEGQARHDWATELRRHLGSGDVTAAIEALWWWLASCLVAERAEPSWTSRELVIKAGRRDLLADVRRLDRMMYGAVRPSTREIGRLWDDLRGVVG